MCAMKFENIVRDFTDKGINLEFKLCPDCETEVSVYNDKYLCPRCGCMKDSCLIRKVTIHKSNNIIKSKKFEFIGVFINEPANLQKYGEIGYELCSVIKTEHETLAYMQREVLGDIEQIKYYEI